MEEQQGLRTRLRTEGVDPVQIEEDLMINNKIGIQKVQEENPIDVDTDEPDIAKDEGGKSATVYI